MGDVAALAYLAKAVALDCLGNHHRRLAVALHRRVVGRIDLLGVVAATAKLLELLVGEVRDHLGQFRIGSEEVLADVAARHDDVLLILAVYHFVHPLDELALLVLGKKRIPFVAPDHLDHIPAGTAKHSLEFLNDLAVASHRAVQPLQVAVDDKHQVVELLACRQRDRPQRLRFVAFAIADEAPDVLVARVLDATILQIFIETRLINRHQRPQAHRDRGEFPEFRHQPRVRVAGKPAAVGQFPAEILEMLLGEPTLEEGAGIDARRRMPLKVDLVAGEVLAATANEMVHRHFHERG